KLGEPGASACRALESAAHFVSRFPFVDSSRLGLSGHSFGGYETNYIVTHSRMFAAAFSASGMYELVGDYGKLMEKAGEATGTISEYYYERGQGRIPYTLWERPDRYILGSPVFFADKVQTPLLLMSNKNDLGVPFWHGVEFFTALRRMGKRV